jgi:riboflavin biosynthesis pyrimidine reductase
VARQCLAAGRLDEIVMVIAPMLLGDGVPMFRQPGGDRVRRERRAGAGTPHWYRVVR